MRVSAAATLFAAVASASPFKFPLSNGFPHLSPKALAAVEKQAGGTLPNTPLPTKLSAEAIATFELVAAVETFEVAYFTELLSNITNKKAGYTSANAFDKKALTAIHAQEQLHATGANAILESAGQKAVPPCEYEFPVTSFADAIALADTFTDVVLGTLPGAQKLFGYDGGQENGLIGLIGAIIGQEAQQDGWYRTLGGKNPSAAPFLTGGAPEFAYSAFKLFVVKGSCPRAENLPIPSYPAITVLNMPKTPMNTMLKMEVEGAVDKSKMTVTYISGQNSPVTVPIKSVTMEKGISTFEAELPFESKGFAHGLSLIAVTKAGRKFEHASHVAADTVYGPGLLEIG